LIVAALDDCARTYPHGIILAMLCTHDQDMVSLPFIQYTYKILSVHAHCSLRFFGSHLTVEYGA